MLYAAIRKSGNVAYGLMQLLWISIHLGRLGIILEMCHRCERENQVTFNLIFPFFNGTYTGRDQERGKLYFNEGRSLVRTKHN